MGQVQCQVRYLPPPQSTYYQAGVILQVVHMSNTLEQVYRKPKQPAADMNFQDMPEALDNTQIEDLISEFAGTLEIVPGTTCIFRFLYTAACALSGVRRVATSPHHSA